MKEKKVLFAAGGTGGHIFPAEALAEDLIENHQCSVMFVGGSLKTNPFFNREQFLFSEIPCGKLSLNPWKFFKGTFAILRGVVSSIRLIQKFKPDCVMGFGSYYTLPVLIASKLTRKPIFLHEQNSIPGRVNRMLAPFVEKTWVHFPETQKLVRGKSEVGGLPLRKELRKGVYTKTSAKALLNLHPERLTFLVFGGSQGAERLNSLFSEAAIFHLKDELEAFQVIHFTGSLAETEKIQQRYKDFGILSYVKEFEKKMEIAWSAADFAITRSGAASIAEQYEFEVPGILIPYPFSTDRHQEKNADFLAESKLAIKLLESGLTPLLLAAKIKEFIHLQSQRHHEFLAYKGKQSINSLSQLMNHWIERKKG